MNTANLMAFREHGLALLGNCVGSDAGFGRGLIAPRQSYTEHGSRQGTRSYLYHIELISRGARLYSKHGADMFLTPASLQDAGCIWDREVQ